MTATQKDSEGGGEEPADLLHNILESVAHELITLGRGFDEERTMLAGKLATLLAIHNPILVDLVAHHNNGDIWIITVTVQFLQPGLQLDQRVTICYVVNENGTQRLPIETRGQAAKAFGSGCVPQCHFIVNAIHIHHGCLKVHTNCDVMVLIEFVLDKATYQAKIEIETSNNAKNMMQRAR